MAAVIVRVLVEVVVVVPLTDSILHVSPPPLPSPLTPLHQIWDLPLNDAIKPQSKEVLLPVTSKGTIHAILYHYTFPLPNGTTFDSSTFPSVGRAINYVDPWEVDPSTSTTTPVTAYRSESQMGFWPVVAVPSFPRGYRMPSWYLEMLNDKVNDIIMRKRRTITTITNHYQLLLLPTTGTTDS